MLLVVQQLTEACAAVALRGNTFFRQAVAASLARDVPLQSAVDTTSDIEASALGAGNVTSSLAERTRLHAAEGEDAIRVSVDGVVDFLFVVSTAYAPSSDEFLSACTSHMSGLLRRLDAAYTDVQLKTVLTHECVNKKLFPATYQRDFSSQQACLDFAKDLVAARDEELSSGSTDHYMNFCKAFYEHTFGPKVDMGSVKCPCVGFDGLQGDTMVKIGDDSVEFPADMGGSCQAWDDSRHPSCMPGETPGPSNGWCAQKWCYVDPCKCDLEVPPKTSSYLRGATFQGKPVYYSYATCGSTDEWTAANYQDACVSQESEDECTADKCAWTGTKCIGKELVDACDAPLAKSVAELVGNEKCKCIGVYNQSGALDVHIASKIVEYPVELGAVCKAWDYTEHPDCKSSSMPDWCEQAWCFVDPCECDLAVPPTKSAYLPGATFQNKPLYWSYATCGAKDSYTASEYKDACVNQASEVDCKALSKCAWTGEKCLGKELVQMCPIAHAEESSKAKKEEPAAKEEPGTAEEPLTKLEQAEAEEDAGGVGSATCPCIGFGGLEGETEVTIYGKKFDYPADLGSTCKAWDNNMHPMCKEGETPGPDNGWCAQQWCYVDPCNCDLKVLPKASAYLPDATFQGKPVYFSYTTCGGNDQWSADFHKDACVNQRSEEDCKALTKCAWDGEKCGGKEIMGMCNVELNDEVVGQKGCRCIGIDNQLGSTKASIGGSLVSYPADLGAICSAWDTDTHPQCKGDDERPDWCGQAWCFVDPCECDLAVPPKTSSYLPTATFQEKPLYWSYATCGVGDTYTAENYKDACVNQETEASCQLNTKCAWNDDKCMGKELTICR